jgi:16S rRNA (guanine527-N7)-methyltransferase
VARAVGELLHETMTVADVGCGGGFPILPLAWANPKLTVMGIEARSKKAHFVAEEAARLGLSNASARAIQAREAARSDDYRQQYDAVVLRAVAETGRMVRDVRGLLKPGGAIINYKTPQAVIAERAITEREASKFGFTVTESEVFALPRDAGGRQFVLLRSTSTSA